MTAHNEDVMTAGVDMIGRTGAVGVQIRWSDDDEPTVWIALARYERPGGTYYQTAAGMNPTAAVLRLCEELCDGGRCRYCKRPTGLDTNWDDHPLDTLICWYLYDPENKTFRRGCEAS